LTADDLHNCADSLIHGGCDFLIAFHCEGMPIVPDTRRFRFLKLAQDRLVPVSATAANGAAVHRLPRGGDVLVPVLAYASHSYLGRAVAHLLDNRRAVLRKVVYENALADALRVMALSHRGIAWLPEQCVALELETRRLVLAGGLQWYIPLEIRIYRSFTNRNPVAQRVWQALAAAHASPHAA
jgi:DNA-binding transcriptional LysR family regulator